MTKRDKDFLRFVRSPQSFSWPEVMTLLVRCGFTVRRQKRASHWNVYYTGRSGVRMLPVPIHNNRPTAPQYFMLLARMVEDWLTSSEDGDSR